jgi:opacity protein-like surface antigen
MMKKTAWMVFFVCVPFLMVNSALAEMYVGAKAGLTWVGSMDVTIPGEAIVENTQYSGPSDIPPPPPTQEDFVGELDFGTGWVLGVALGTTVADDFRVEGELEYRSSDFDIEGLEGEDTLSTLSLMLNGYYDFQTGSALTPYVGAGIGWARHDIDDADVDDSVFAYQATLGVCWALNDTMALDFAYRYFATADPEFGDGEDAQELEYDSHNLTAGIRYKF